MNNLTVHEIPNLVIKYLKQIKLTFYNIRNYDRTWNLTSKKLKILRFDYLYKLRLPIKKGVVLIYQSEMCFCIGNRYQLISCRLGGCCILPHFILIKSDPCE